MTDSQLMTVTYEDPEDRLQQDRLLAQMRKYIKLDLIITYYITSLLQSHQSTITALFSHWSACPGK